MGDKGLFRVATNGGTWGICASYLSEIGNASLLDISKHGYALSTIIFTEKASERRVSHSSKTMK